MLDPIRVRAPGLLALGVLFAGVTTATILKDVVIDGAAFNLTHAQSIAAMIAAVSAGHLIVPTALKGRLPAAAGLLLVFLAATAYIVVSAGARNAETAGVKTQAIEKRNAEREAAREVLAKAEAATARAEQTATAAIKAAADECGSGKGGRCRGKEATREAAKDDLAKARDAESLARGKLLLLGPDENAHEGYHHAARTFEAIGIGTTAVTEAKLELLMPFALVLISELATLIFFGMAIGHTATPGNPAATAKTAATVPATVGNDNENCEGCPPPTGGNRATLPAGNSRTVATKAAAEADVIRLVARGEQLPSQDALAARWGIHKGTASKWLSDFERRGLIARHREGRAKRVAAA